VNDIPAIGGPDVPVLSDAPVGLVDGSQEANTSRMHVVLEEDATLQLDELVVMSQKLPDGSELKHYGIVVEARGHIEGAEISSDTRRITGTMTMPGTTTRTAELQVLRTVPEKWLPPAPGAVVRPARGNDRHRGLFLDQMETPLAVGHDQFLQPVYADFAFINGEKGGHLSISGISGVATKTSYAAFILYMLMETPQGRGLLGAHAPGTRALVFNVKGEDLLHLDRRNSKFDAMPDARAGWAALGVPDPGPFHDVQIYAATPRLGHLISCGVVTPELNRAVTVVDIHGLHDSGQRFVVGALLSKVFEDKQGSGREPLRFIVLDELNKYAPRQGTSPIKDVLIDIAARGRSLGVLLIGAQQSAGDVDGNIIRNAALKVVGRLDAGEAGDYKFLSTELRERASRFLPGTMVLDQPLIPAPLPLRFPFPAFATNVAEGAPSAAETLAAGEALLDKL